MADSTGLTARLATSEDAALLAALGASGRRPLFPPRAPASWLEHCLLPVIVLREDGEPAGFAAFDDRLPCADIEAVCAGLQRELESAAIITVRPPSHARRGQGGDTPCLVTQFGALGTRALSLACPPRTCPQP
jgi:hypothetical protein